MMTYDSKFFDIVRSHLKDDPSTLRLRYAGKQIDGYDSAEVILQVECRKRFGKKLQNTLASFPDFFFPSVLSGEQSTSDLLSQYHSSLVASGIPAADLTAGLGIDVFHASQRASEVIAVEINCQLAKALEYNANGLNIDNISIVNADCRQFVKAQRESGNHYGTIFIDPARRADDGSRIFALDECHPDVTQMMSDLSELCDLLIIKASPMLDISHTISTLSPALYSVIAVGTPTECKELLALVNFKAPENEKVLIQAVTLTPGSSTTFSFTQQLEAGTTADTPQTDPTKIKYVYEPFPALIKTGAFKVLAHSYGLRIFNPNTRIFYSERFVADFPGNVYQVIEVLPYASKVIKRFSRKYPAANVAVRNFGISAEALRGRLNVRDSGPIRVYGVTDSSDERLLIVAQPYQEAQ